MEKILYSVSSGGIRVAVQLPDDAGSGCGRITFYNTSNGQRLFVTNGLNLLCPVVDGERLRPALQSIRQQEGLLELVFSGGGLTELVLTLDGRGEALLLSSSFLTSGTELNALEILPSGSMVNFYDLINFRNHHGTPSTWPELPLADKVDTTTFSSDWQFAPHPSMLLFRKNETVVLAAPLDLPKAFGFRFRCTRYLLEQWDLDYGPAGHGEPLTAGQRWSSPVFALVKEERPAAGRGYDANVYGAIDRYCQLLIQGGYIPDPARRERYRWHRENLYCTWVDEAYTNRSRMVMELQNQSEWSNARDCLNESLVRQAVEVIRREQLPFTTILIDSGWQKARGQWEVDTQKFPDFRGLIDELHDQGFKVILWINFADIDDGAAVDEAFLCPGYRNRHGLRVWNYSDPLVQREYLDPLIRRMISDEPGCYNADGIKTDFLADKVHPDTPCAPQWRGEENYLVHLIGHVYRTMKRYKPDSCHIGCAGHPYLAEYMDVIRTYDIFTSNVREHLERGRMVRHCSAGTPVAFDFHNLNENFDQYFTAAADNGCSVEVGSILGMKRDYLADWEPADAAFYDLLRQGLRRFL